MKFHTTLCIIFAGICISSCGALRGAFCAEPCPYIASAPEIVLAQKDGVCGYAYAVFEFYNDTGLAVEAVSCSLRIYDEDNAQTLNADNIVTACASAGVPARSKKEIFISLDDVLYDEGAGTYTAERFYISRIEYADGSVWEDTWGIHAR